MRPFPVSRNGKLSTYQWLVNRSSPSFAVREPRIGAQDRSLPLSQPKVIVGWIGSLRHINQPAASTTRNKADPNAKNCAARLPHECRRAQAQVDGHRGFAAQEWPRFFCIRQPNGNQFASTKEKGPAISRKPLISMVAREGIEPPTRGFSITFFASFPVPANPRDCLQVVVFPI